MLRPWIRPGWIWVKTQRSQQQTQLTGKWIGIMLSSDRSHSAMLESSVSGRSCRRTSRAQMSWSQRLWRSWNKWCAGFVSLPLLPHPRVLHNKTFFSVSQCRRKHLASLLSLHKHINVYILLCYQKHEPLIVHTSSCTVIPPMVVVQ